MPPLPTVVEVAIFLIGFGGKTVICMWLALFTLPDLVEWLTRRKRA